MEEKIMYIKMILSITCGFFIELLGGADRLLTLILHLVIIDFLLGILCSVKRKDFSSTIAKWGFVSKFFYFIIISLCYLIDGVVGNGCFLRNIAIVWFSICEGASILENAVILGVPLPQGIVEILAQAKNGFSIRIIDIVKKMIEELCGEQTSAEKENNKGDCENE